MNNASAGFTLIELVIVVVILSIGLSLTLPMFDSGIGSNEFRTGLRRIHAIVNEARYRAIIEKKTLKLHIIFPQGKEKHAQYTIQKGVEADSSKNTKPLFSGEMLLTGIKKESKNPSTSGIVEIKFLPRGLAEPATLHVQYKGQKHRIKIQAFSPRLLVRAG